MPTIASWLFFNQSWCKPMPSCLCCQTLQRPRPTPYHLCSNAWRPSNPDCESPTCGCCVHPPCSVPRLEQHEAQHHIPPGHAVPGPAPRRDIYLGMCSAGLSHQPSETSPPKPGCFIKELAEHQQVSYFYSKLGLEDKIMAERKRDAECAFWKV